jgi:hypothetical protein
VVRSTFTVCSRTAHRYFAERLQRIDRGASVDVGAACARSGVECPQSVCSCPESLGVVKAMVVQTRDMNMDTAVMTAGSTSDMQEMPPPAEHCAGSSIAAAGLAGRRLECFTWRQLATYMESASHQVFVLVSLVGNFFSRFAPCPSDCGHTTAHALCKGVCITASVGVKQLIVLVRAS